MSISTDGLAIPEWDLADRLAKSLRVADMSVQQMADYLDVHRNTVSAWTNGRTPPSTQSLRLWALRTGVPFDWLTGTPPGPIGPDGAAVPSRLRYSKPRPSHYQGRDRAAIIALFPKPGDPSNVPLAS